MCFGDCSVLNNDELSYENLTKFNKTKVQIVWNWCASIYLCVSLNNSKWTGNWNKEKEKEIEKWVLKSNIFSLWLYFHVNILIIIVFM